MSFSRGQHTTSKNVNKQLNFSRLIGEYKQENFKRMPILHHEFVYACFHPTLDDCVIALEKNYYPRESELFSLEKEEGSFYTKLIKHLEGLKDISKLRKLSQMLGIDRKLLTIITEEDVQVRVEEQKVKVGQAINSSFNGTKTNQFGLFGQMNDNERVEYESSKSLITFESDKRSNVNESMMMVADMNDEELKTNKDMIADAIKHEILTRINSNMNRNSSIQKNIQIGAKIIGQVISKGFRPQLPTNLMLSGLTPKEDEVKEETVMIESDNKGIQTKRQKLVLERKKIQQFATIGGEEHFLEFGFEEPISLREIKMEGANKKKYGISIWKLNRGQQAYQIKEYPFNLLPASSKFFISHDSKYILVFLVNENEHENSFESIRILDIETLEVINEVRCPELSQIDPSSLTDAALIWNSSFIYIQIDSYCFFLNVKSQEIDYFFELQLESNNSTKTLKHALFKESEPRIFYSIVLSNKTNASSDQESFLLYKVNIERSENIFEQRNVLTPITQGTGIEYNGTIGYNKYLSQIVFPGEQVYYIFSLRTKMLKPFRNVQNCQVEKNSFLNEYCWIAFNDDNYDTFTVSTQNLVKKYHLTDMDLDDFSLGDIMKERKTQQSEQCILSIGKKGEKEASSRICINVTRPDGSEPFINYIQETSEYIFAYPFIIYCKGNAELFIQSLHQPERLIKLDLQDRNFLLINHSLEFLCFVEMNSYIRLKPLHMALGLTEGNQCFRQYESVAFLSQQDDKIFLNVLEYTPYGYDKQYTYYRSQQSIQRPKTSYGNILKAVFQKVKHKECKDHDYILILQYRNHVLIRSFFNFFVLNIDKYIFKFPMIYLPSKYKDQPDMCFFVSKDGYSTKIERIGFNGKDFKDPLSTAYELKTSNIFVFTYHDKRFYLMDDTLSLKQFEYDKRSQKFKYLKQFEFSLEYRDILAQTVDFNDIQVTDRGVYRGLLFIPFYDSNLYNKEIRFLKTDPVLNIPENELFSGPKKQNGTQYMLYIARAEQSVQVEETPINDSFENDIQSLEDESEQEEDYEIGSTPDTHNIPPSSPPKTRLSSDLNSDRQSFLGETGSKLLNFNENQVMRSKSIHRHTQSIDQKVESLMLKSSNTIKIRSPSGNMQRSKTEFQMAMLQSIKGKRQMMNEGIPRQQEKKKTFKGTPSHSSFTLDTNGHQNHQDDQVYAWITPYLDSNVLHLTHNIKDNNNPKYQVSFSTFINNQEDILCQINQVFYLYSKNGTFLYQLNVNKDNTKNSFYFQQKGLTLENISTNLTYYLFFDSKDQQYEVFELVKDKTLTEGIKFQMTRQNHTRSKTRHFRHSSYQSGNFHHSERQQSFQYMFQYVKTIKQFGSYQIKEDYFNRTQLSNFGHVYQMVSMYKHQHLNNKIDGKSNSERHNDHQLEFFSEFNTDKNIFKFYIDEEDKSLDLIERFTLIKEHLKTDITPTLEASQFGYTVLGEYLFIKRNTRLEFMKIFEIDKDKGEKKYSLRNQKPQFVHLMLDKNSQIERLMQTASQSPELVQIIFSDDRFMYVMTWDINANIEHQMMQIEKKFNFNAGHVVCKGITERHNYIPIDNCFYDLYFGLPFKFFQNISKRNPLKAKMNMSERKFSLHNKEYLDLYENNKVLKSYNYLDLCYLKALQNLNLDEIDQSHIHPEHLHIRVHGQTFFSFIALDHHLLKEVFDELTRVDEQSNPQSHVDTVPSNSYKILFIHLLYPDYNNISTFDIAMDKKSPKSIEIMLEMLCQMSNFSLSKFFMHHFSELFQMELLAFQNFLSSCLFQLPRMREIKVIKWIHNQEEYFVDYHTSYLGDAFYKKVQNKPVARICNRSHNKEINEIVKDQQTISSSDESFIVNEDDQEDDVEDNSKEGNVVKNNHGILGVPVKDQMRNQGALENMQWKREFEVGELKRVETVAVEFDWIFRGKNAVSFIEHLAHNANDSIFEVDTIRIIALFLWERFFYNIRNKIFLPYMLYFILFMIQVALLYQKRTTIYDEVYRYPNLHQDSVYTEEDYSNWKTADDVVIGFLFAFWSYFLIIELKQIYYLRKEYFKDFWNWLDLASLALNCEYLIADLLNNDPDENRTLSAVATLLMWIKVLYFLRLFAPTAALIRMIGQISRDMSVFLTIFFLVIIGFSFSYYILAYNVSQDDHNVIFEDNFFLALLYGYRLTLGDLNTTKFDNSLDRFLFYALFIAQTIILNIVLLNLLIAIMGDSFDKVTEKKEESKLREICEMMSDYEGIMDREREFKHSKYIIVTKLEKAQTNNAHDWEGRLASIKAYFQQVSQDIRKEAKQMNENLREEVIGNSKAMEQKFMDLQTLIMKQSSQLTLAMKKIDKVNEVVKTMNQKKELKDYGLIESTVQNHREEESVEDKNEGENDRQQNDETPKITQDKNY